MVEVTRGKVAEGEELVLYNACCDGFAAAVSVVLEMEGVDVNDTVETADSRGGTGLYVASQLGHLDVVKLLLGAEEKKVEIEHFVIQYSKHTSRHHQLLNYLVRLLNHSQQFLLINFHLSLSKKE